MMTLIVQKYGGTSVGSPGRFEHVAEQVTIALLSMALEKRGCPARSYTGAQVRILTDSAFNKARIRDIDEQAVRKDLADGRVVVVAGFQGVDEEGNITTLGRGGSDTTAVALVFVI